MRAIRIEELHERPELLQVVRTRFARTFFCAGFIRNGCAVADRIYLSWKCYWNR